MKTTRDSLPFGVAYGGKWGETTFGWPFFRTARTKRLLMLLRALPAAAEFQFLYVTSDCPHNVEIS